MAFPKLLQMLFQSSGSEEKLREDIMPREYLPLAGGTVAGDLGVEGSITGQRLKLDNGSNTNLEFRANSNGDGGFYLAGDDHNAGEWVKILTANSATGGGVAPPGAMIAFAGKSVPEGWLLCNGAAISRTTYAKLFAAIGTTWGTGDGSTTFNIPAVDERYFEPTVASNCVGLTADAQLPNITGYAWNGARGMYSTYTGCFAYTSSLSNYYDWGKEGSMYIKDGLWFRASDSNGTYGRASYGESGYVRPKSFRAFMLIKY